MAKLTEEYNLAICNPELAKEWDYEKNGDLKPTDITVSSGKKVWWKCKLGHSYSSIVDSRNAGSGCPYCSNQKVLAGFNDLATKNPELAKEWDYAKNGDLKPIHVTPNSGKKVWWKCKLGHSYSAKVNSRSNNTRCPFCSNRNVLVGFNDLATENPELAKEWDYEKNGDLKPTDITVSSGKKVWWKCKLGHSYSSIVDSRNAGSGCPYCSNQKVLPGFNDLATKNPELAKEWDYEKTSILKPTDVTVCSHKKVWWRCKLGHRWQAVVANRNMGTSCPECNKENKTSFPEQAIFYYLKKFFLLTENRNTGVLGLELDIYIPELRIGIEYDGVFWHQGNAKQKNDIKKSKLCIEQGITLYRILEPGLSIDPNCICICRADMSTWALEQSIKELFLLLNLPTNQIDLQRDQAEILAAFLKDKENNSLICVNPELAKEWDYEKNGDLKPTHVTPNSGKKVWWKCKLGHSYSATIANRTSFRDHTGCPYCSNRKVLPGFNDLATKNPELAKEWDYEKTSILKPTDVTVCSHKKVWWKCKEGHSYQAVIYARNHGKGCPYCSGRNAITGITDLATKKPKLAEEWDYEKNGDLKPTDITVSSGKKVWWKCKEGHSYPSIVSSRSAGSGCPECYNIRRRGLLEK